MFFTLQMSGLCGNNTTDYCAHQVQKRLQGRYFLKLISAHTLCSRAPSLRSLREGGQDGERKNDKRRKERMTQKEKHARMTRK